MTRLQAIREKVIEAVTEINSRPSRLVQKSPTDIPPTNLGPEIHLADVLLAMPEGDETPLLTTEGQFVMYSPEDGSIALSGKWWNLRNDDLEAQSEETISFIHSLLCV